MSTFAAHGLQINTNHTRRNITLSRVRTWAPHSRGPRGGERRPFKACRNALHWSGRDTGRRGNRIGRRFASTRVLLVRAAAAAPVGRWGGRAWKRPLGGLGRDVAAAPGGRAASGARARHGRRGRAPAGRRRGARPEVSTIEVGAVLPRAAPLGAKGANPRVELYRSPHASS